MRYCFLLLLNLLLGPGVQGIQEGRRGVLVLMETGDCEGCDEKDRGEGEEGRVQCIPRVQSPSLAVEWTVQRIQLLSLSKQEIGEEKQRIENEISSEPPFSEWHLQFTTIPFKTLTEQG